MEATIQSSNIQINVSINIDAMKANIQRCLQSIKQYVYGEVTKYSILNYQFSITRFYHKILRMMYAIGRATERHPAIADTVLWLTGIGLVIEIIFFV